MGKLTRNLILGGALGAIAPLSIALINEIGHAYYKGGDIAMARICFADRHWQFLNLRITHAPGCRNRFIDTIPLFMALFAGGGAALGMHSSRSKSGSTKPTDDANLSNNQSSILPSVSAIKNKELIGDAESKSSEVIKKGNDFAQKKIQRLPMEELKNKTERYISDLDKDEIKKAIGSKVRELTSLIKSQEIPQNIKAITKGNMAKTAISIFAALFLLRIVTVAWSHNKEKIVFVTEEIQCRYYNRVGRCDRGAPWGYYDTSGKKFSTDLEAVLSSCRSISMLEQEFIQKVNSDIYRVKSTTDWNREVNSKNDGIEWPTSKPTTYKYRANCIGKQYVVSY